MKFWTIQTKQVIEVVNIEGIYQPDFKYSRYLKEISELSDLYGYILESYNQLNNKSLPGVIFAFAKHSDDKIEFINNIQEFMDFVREKQFAIGGFWENLIKRKEQFEIIELSYNEEFNPIFIDINDFQLLMPPIELSWYSVFTEESIKRIINSICFGNYTVSELPSGVVQAHLPYIKKDNVLNVYPIFDI